MQDHASGGTVEQRRSVLTTLALGLSTFLILFDVTAVVVAMPAIAKDVGLDIAGLAWVIDAYSLAFTGTLLASGALADRFGSRRCMLAGNVSPCTRTRPAWWRRRRPSCRNAKNVSAATRSVIPGSVWSPSDRLM